MSWTRLGISGVIAAACAWSSLPAARADEHKADPAAATVGHAESEHVAGAKDEASVDPLIFDPDLAIFSLVVFVALLVVLKKFAWGPIIEALEGREKNIANHIAQAERSHEEAKRLLAQYEQKLSAAANDVRELMDEARRDAEHAKQDILAEAKAGAEAERTRALRDIEAAADQAMESLAQRSAQLAVDLAGKILQSKLSSADHAKLIEEAMAKFPKSTPSAN
jgi:F-type H+-transporting ATPase subunit b